MLTRYRNSSDLFIIVVDEIVMHHRLTFSFQFVEFVVFTGVLVSACI